MDQVGLFATKMDAIRALDDVAIPRQFIVERVKKAGFPECSPRNISDFRYRNKKKKITTIKIDPNSPLDLNKELSDLNLDNYYKYLEKTQADEINELKRKTAVEIETENYVKYIDSVGKELIKREDSFKEAIILLKKVLSYQNINYILNNKEKCANLIDKNILPILNHLEKIGAFIENEKLFLRIKTTPWDAISWQEYRNLKITFLNPFCEYTKMTRQELINEIKNKNDLTSILSNKELYDVTSTNNAMRWYLRGLPVRTAIEKAVVDKNEKGRFADRNRSSKKKKNGEPWND